MPEELEKLIGQALAWNPADRPVAEELAGALFALAPTLPGVAVRKPAEHPQDAEDTSLQPAVKWPG